MLKQNRSSFQLKTMFCPTCGAETADDANFCVRCGTDLKPSCSKDTSAPSSTNTATSTNLSKPEGLFPIHKKIKSFLEYKVAKGSQWKSKVTKDSNNGKPNVVKEKDVCIYIGMMEWTEKDCILKPKRGKRLALRVSNKANYSTLLEKAQEKWKAYYPNLYEKGEEYLLLYESGEMAMFLPGSAKEFFCLEKYQTDLGKDFKRITLYLCSFPDYNISLCIDDTEENDIDLQLEQSDLNLVDTSPSKRYKYDCVTTDDSTQMMNSDEQLAKSLQQSFDEELQSEVHDLTAAEVPVHPQEEIKVEFTDYASVVRHLENQVDTSGQFFIVTRRKAPIQRTLTLWQRAASKATPEKQLQIRFSGEEGIDTGALKKEFLTDTMESMCTVMFPGGSPFDSTYHVHNGNFSTCGQIAAVSLAQSGPHPCILEECVYNSLVNLDMSVTALNPETHLTKSERELLEHIRNNPETHIDTIIEHGYTGVIDKEHTEDIIGSVVVSVVSKRLLYLKEFMHGLKLYGLDSIILQNPEVCKPLFVKGLIDDPVDANYLFSIVQPEYSSFGSSRRELEVSVMDNFQDFLNNLEDTNMTGFSAPISWNYEEEDGTKVEPGMFDNLPPEQFESPDMSAAGVMGWLTGQKHKPLSGKKLLITALFDHDCLSRNPCHSICFPVVGACGMQITFPVTHMKDEDEFRKIFLLAFCNGQAFSKP